MIRIFSMLADVWEKSGFCVEPDLNRRVLDVTQDTVYCASNSRCKIPKHVGLAVSVKHLSGSKQVIKMLNSIGHSLSYEDIGTLDSTIADNLASRRTEGSFLPSNINWATFSHAAIDNIDINEETKSGKGTTHVLGSIIYQEKGTGIARSLQGTFPETEHPFRIKPLEILRRPRYAPRDSVPRHLLNTVDAKSWFPLTAERFSLNKLFVFT